MIDLVTVVFAPEIQYLKIQAQSIQLYAKDLGIKNIFVVVNDHESVQAQIQPTWWAGYAPNVKIIHRDHLACGYHDHGWHSQQALKLLASAQSQNQYCMVLDAKTFFVQECQQRGLFHNNKICMRSQPIAPVFGKSQTLVNELFDVNMTHVAGPAGVPHLFSVTEVQHMLNFIETKSESNFATWFQQHPMVTEFILYSGWLHKSQGNLAHSYLEKQHYQVVNVCHTEAMWFDMIFSRMHASDVLTVGVHRNAWPQLSAIQKLQYLEFLQSRGLLSDVDHMLALLNQTMKSL